MCECAYVTSNLCERADIIWRFEQRGFSGVSDIEARRIAVHRDERQDWKVECAGAERNRYGFVFISLGG